jgi:hypothetical protein
LYWLAKQVKLRAATEHANSCNSCKSAWGPAAPAAVSMSVYSRFFFCTG